MQLAAAIGVACGAVIGVMTVAEKITGLGARWLARGVEAGTRALREDVNDVHQRLCDVEAEVRALRRERGQG